MHRPGERIDSDAIVAAIVVACDGIYPTLKQARCVPRDAARARLFQRQRDDIIESAVPYGRRFVGRLRLPTMSRIEVEDLEGVAGLAIVEGIDSFDHTRGVAITTHLTFRLHKRIYEAKLDHWGIMKPPKKLAKDYLAGRLTALEQDAYIDRYVRPFDSEHTDNLDEGMAWADRAGNGGLSGGGLGGRS